MSKCFSTCYLNKVRRRHSDNANVHEAAIIIIFSGSMLYPAQLPTDTLENASLMESSF